MGFLGGRTCDAVGSAFSQGVYLALSVVIQAHNG